MGSFGLGLMAWVCNNQCWYTVVLGNVGKGIFLVTDWRTEESRGEPMAEKALPPLVAPSTLISTFC